MIVKIRALRIDKDRLVKVVLPGLIVAAALLIRVFGLNSESAWLDEAYSITLAKYPIAQILQGTAADQHPPLYYLLLHFWLLFGSSVSVARLLSAILGTINVFQAIWLGNELAGRRVGLGLGILLAVSPYHVWYSQEARQYMLLVCLTTAATKLLWSCLQGKKRWWLYCLVSVLAIYTQYFAVFIFMAHAVILLIWTFVQKNWKPARNWVLSIAAVLLAFLPWLPTALNQFRFHTMPWISEPAGGDIRDVPLKLLFGGGVTILPAILRWIGIVVLVLIAVWLLSRYTPTGAKTRLKIGFILSWLIVPFAAISLVSIVVPVFQFKQFMIILVPLLFLVTWMLDFLPRKIGGIIFILFFCVTIATTGYQQVTTTKDDWRQVAAYIQQNEAAGDLVFGNPAAGSLALGLYWPTPLQFQGYPPDYNIIKGGWTGSPLDERGAAALLQADTQGHLRVWLVEQFPEFWDARHYLADWLSTHGTKLDDQYFGKIHVRLFGLAR